jgi:hypothetical protein
MTISVFRIRKLSTPNPAMDHTTSREGVGSHQNEEPAGMAGSDQLAGQWPERDVVTVFSYARKQVARIYL